MDDKFIAKLKYIAEEETISDRDDFVADDYAGGNIDDAFQSGCREGEIFLAREVLTHLKIEYTIPERT